MTLLHVYFALRNQQAFQRLLDNSTNERTKLTGRSPSGGKSWSKSTLYLAEVNARDDKGRTVLHLAAAAPDGTEYIRLLLRHPSININVQDAESRWTALHRALYNGNIPAALLLLQRNDIDVTLRDTEGYTPFDLYNSTVEGTSPPSDFLHGELYTWGTNRNAALGLGDGDDRQFPEQVTLRPKDVQPHTPLAKRFAPLPVKQVQMSKLHTAVVTADERANVHVCGFGSGGRLGPGQHTQYSLSTLYQCPPNVASVALGQDHTLLLTKSGEVFSFGLNRFSQLGYTIEPTTGNRLDEPIQTTPKKIVGPLKKEVVIGVAASRCASACWTSESVFTWGLNNGQLGYDKAAQPVQVLPRKVTKITHPAVSICLSDSTLACLLVSKEVICICNDRVLKISFPSNVFPAEIQPYRPPQAVKNTEISSITNCDDTFACLSSSGELFTFLAPGVSEIESISPKGFKPQRVVVLKRPFSAIKDVAVGSDGTLIVCTQSGHVFVRSRNGGNRQVAGPNAPVANKGFKFVRLPYLQRVVKVCSNSTGSFAALRSECEFPPVKVVGNTLSEDLASVRPFWELVQPEYPTDSGSLASVVDADDEDEEDSTDGDIHRDVFALRHMCKLLAKDRERSQWSSQSRLPYGADIIFQHASGATFPAHRSILAARSPALLALMSKDVTQLKDSESNVQLRLSSASSRPTVQVRGCHAMSFLILLNYLYTDNVLAIWDHRVSTPLKDNFRQLGVEPNQVKVELQTFGRLLKLGALSEALVSASKRVPTPTVVRDVALLHDKSSGSATASPLSPDMILEFADAKVPCHSVILRARSPFFASFCDELDWTVKRRDSHNVVEVDMKHRSWHVMRFVIRFLCCGEDVFDNNLDFVQSVDQLLEFMFDVISAANELLLDRLVLICSSIILEHTSLTNVCYVLAEATHYHAVSLVESVQMYMSANLETFLESQIIDILEPALVKQFANFVRKKQVDKYTMSRGELVRRAMEANKDWIALQDFAVPIVRSEKQVNRKGSSASMSSPRKSPVTASTPLQSSKAAAVPEGEDLFAMDDVEPSPAPVSRSPPSASALTMSPMVSPAPSGPSGWKATSSQKVDMRAVFAEAAASSPSSRNPPPLMASKAGPSHALYRPPQRGTGDVPDRSEAKPAGGSSPWKVPTAKPTPPVTSTPPVGPSTPPAATSRAAQPQTPPRAQAPGQTPGLGPVYTPSRQAPVKPSPIPSQRRVSSNSGKAWSSPAPAPQPSPPASCADGMSFVAIQELQREQGMPQVKDRRSLKEIQEEEASRRQEEEFLKWWAAEEERVRVENEETEALLAQAPSSQQPRSQKRPRRYKKPAGAGKQAS